MFQLPADVPVYLRHAPVDLTVYNGQKKLAVLRHGGRCEGSANIYSPMLTCRACGVEPFMSLRHVLTKLPQRAAEVDVTDLLPFHFAQQRQGNLP